MQERPGGKYWRREYLDEDLNELREAGFSVVRLDCGARLDDAARQERAEADAESRLTRSGRNLGRAVVLFFSL